mmetsp:Transcript_19228/g.49653  ORF Transcript_19228/g.49653 Transcript_19228/m.49653 type:complete len:220 (+) Transcript_19228:15-674(+)
MSWATARRINGREEAKSRARERAKRDGRREFDARGERIVHLNENVAPARRNNGREEVNTHARERAKRDGRRELDAWGELGAGAVVAPFAGPYGPIILPNPRYFNDRKWDEGRHIALARELGADRPWSVSAGPIPHWTEYNAGRDRYNPAGRRISQSAAPVAAKTARRRPGLPAAVRARLAEQELAAWDWEASASAPSGEPSNDSAARTIAFSRGSVHNQ